LLRNVDRQSARLIFVKERRAVSCSVTWLRPPARRESPEDVLGKTDADLLRQSRPENTARTRSRSWPRGASRSTRRNARNTGESGELRWSHTIKVPLKDKAGNVVGLMGIARDYLLERNGPKKKLSAAQTDVGPARQAGMAETATSVLPQRGNVSTSGETCRHLCCGRDPEIQIAA